MVPAQARATPQAVYTPVVYDEQPIKPYIKAKLPNDAELLVEVIHLRQHSDTERDVVSIDQVLSLASIRDAIRGVSTVVFEAMETVRPNKASVEFGIEIGVDTGGLTAVLVKGTAKANLKVTLEWSSPAAKS